MLIGSLLADWRAQPRGLVLVVDDDTGVRTAIDAALSAEGYSVVTATDGVAALDLAESHELALILLDIRMPRMDGPDFARAYAAMPGPHAPTVVLSAADDAAWWAKQIGANGHLEKPFDLDDLLALVQRYTAGPDRLD
jgi:CheY-like chemotaxis protein